MTNATKTNKATHNGHCQVCGRPQARRTLGLAKHGYTVEWGFFQGACTGSDVRPIEEATDRLDATVERLNDEADRLEALTADQITKVAHSVTAVDRYGKRTRAPRIFDRDAWATFQIEDPRYGDTYYSFERMQAATLRQLQGQAKAMRSHAEALLTLKRQFAGKPLTPRNAQTADPTTCAGSGKFLGFPKVQTSNGRLARCPDCGDLIPRGAASGKLRKHKAKV